MKNMEEKVYSRKDKYIIILICVIIILVLVLVWQLSRTTDEQFAAEFTFAATISSIILSIVAIFMSITSESKTSVIREKIEKEADDIEEATKEMKMMLQQLGGKIDSIKEDTGIIQASINNIDQSVPISQTPKEG